MRQQTFLSLRKVFDTIEDDLGFSFKSKEFLFVVCALIVFVAIAGTGFYGLLKGTDYLVASMLK